MEGLRRCTCRQMRLLRGSMKQIWGGCVGTMSRSRYPKEVFGNCMFTITNSFSERIVSTFTNHAIELRYVKTLGS